ncbi:MAG: sigma-70 family RNA polymerase sigma factor [Archangium sp.]|nr:sigma-70 family RNA polymerase sigma factor [Archangium sp.]MDP3152255.1 sigma-70 family RNA polymerase sigma factor [Archangium sp.]MDP3570651.1 sigma-70 family RNA polymerase sigma factor [Archangium sp.]
MRPEAPDIARLYAAHARQVWRTLVRLGVPTATVEDAVQDVFLTAHQRLSGFEGRSNPGTWLVGIAVRVAANARRAVARRGVLRVVDDAMVDPGRGPEQQLERHRALQALEAVLSRLPEEQREVVVLIDLEQLTAPQAAEALEVKLNTVSSRLRLGRAALSKALKESRDE